MSTAAAAPDTLDEASTGTTWARAIEVRGLWVRYGYRSVLRDVSLTVAAGERVALLGPNGAGKSTLLRTLATLTRPHGGQVSVAGLDLMRDGEKTRAQIGFLGHRPHAYEQFTGRENLRFLARLWQVEQPEPSIRRALDAVGLTHDADRRAGGYSRGMQQRLGLAAAMLHGPAALLLDEPDAGLDRPAVEGLPALIDQLCPGAAVLFATHDHAVAELLADRTIRISDGALSEPRTAVSPARGLPALPRRRAGPGFFTATAAVLRKDLQLEWRGREQLPVLLVFGLMLAIVFGMAFAIPGARETPAIAAGALWASMLLAAILAGVRTFGGEHDRGTLTALRLAPVDLGAVFAGKVALVAVQAAAVGLVQLGALSVLLNTNLFEPAVLATLGLAALALGSLVGLQSALVASSRARELLMPVLALPLAIPVMLAGVGATLDSLSGAGAGLPWLGLLGVISVVFLSAALLLYPYTQES